MDPVTERYVVSAPRSGLNWLRYCVERFYGLPTPGKDALIAKPAQASLAFIRSHDPLGRTKGKTGSVAWSPIDPAAVAGARVLLIVRDPLEIFVRMARGKLRLFRIYADNLRFFVLADTPSKLCVHYEDIVGDPRAMWQALAFLDLAPAPGVRPPDMATLAGEWDEASRASRALYDVNQKRGGGSVTGGTPADFGFHQRRLSRWQKLTVWNWIDRNLGPDEKALIERYRPHDLHKDAGWLAAINRLALHCRLVR